MTFVQGQPRHGSPCDSDDDMYRSQKRKDNAFPKRKNQDDGDKVTDDTVSTLTSHLMQARMPIIINTSCIAVVKMKQQTCPVMAE